jgi:hypothetical protein
MKEKINKLVNKLFETKTIRVLYMYDPLGNIKLKIYDKDYKIILGTYGTEKEIYQKLKVLCD